MLASEMGHKDCVCGLEGHPQSVSSPQMQSEQTSHGDGDTNQPVLFLCSDAEIW